MAPVTHPLFQPARLGPVEVRNRMVKAATFEGMARDGLVSDELIEFHRAHARGGVGLTTLAYVSVAPEGRTYRNQVWVRDEAMPGLARLADAVHTEGAAIAAQVGHAGWFANPRATGGPCLGPSRKFSPSALRFSRALNEPDLDRLLADFERSARMLVAAGFDALEVHLGHGYLLSQFLSPWTNKRRDAYGGDIERRAEFPRRAVRAVREGSLGRAAVTVKLNMTDGFRSGLQIDDAVVVARLLQEDGSVDAIQLTGGFTARTPMFLMRGDVPLKELAAAEPDRLRRLGMRLASPWILRGWPFGEAFFRPMARRFLQAVDVPLMLLGGITRLETMTSALDEGFGFVAMARALLHDRDLPNKLAAGSVTSSACDHNNRCIVTMEHGGTRCVLLDATQARSAQ